MNEERYTISSLLSRLIEIEDKAYDFYITQERTVTSLQTIFSLFSKEHQEIANKIETTKRETIVEFTLEPISGVDIEKCFNDIEDIILNNKITLLDKSITIEERISQIHSKISENIARMSGEAAQLLLSSVRKTEKRLKILGQLKKENSRPEYK